MKSIGQWITNFFIIAAVFAANIDAKTPGVKAVILYMFDDATVGSNVVSMEVDKQTFMNVIKDSQFAARAAKPMTFGQDNGFFALLNGESSSFSFATATGLADCSCQCAKKVETTPFVTSRTTTHTFVTPAIPTKTTARPVITTVPNVPTTRTSPERTTTPGPTYLPPTTLPPTSQPRARCSNGAPDSAYPDCCINGGRGQYCCTNGATNPECSFTVTTLRPPTTTQRNVPKCSNGAPDSAYPDCCINGGRGQYCCTNGANNPECGFIMTHPPTPPPRISTVPPTYLPPSTLPPTSPPKISTLPPTPPPRISTLPPTPPPRISTIPPTYLPPSTLPPTSPPRISTLPPTGPPPKVPRCSNGAPDSAYPDCCTNGGRGKYCCTNGESNPSCSPAKFTTATPNVECPNGGRGKYCCKNGANTPNCEIPTSKPFKGPTYLPLPTISTTRIPYTEGTYTYGPAATHTYSYNWTFGPWSRDPRPTKSYTTTTTAKYAYDGPANKLAYFGESDNSV